MQVGGEGTWLCSFSLDVSLFGSSSRDCEGVQMLSQTPSAPPTLSLYPKAGKHQQGVQPAGMGKYHQQPLS